jgi:hypothetical protein
LQSNLVGLSQLTSSLAWSPNRDHAAKLGLAHLPGILGADIAFIALLDREREPMQWSEWLFANHTQSVHLSRARTIFFQQLLERMTANAPQVAMPLTLNSHGGEASLARASLSAVHVAPILSGDMLQGVLVVANYHESQNTLTFAQAQLCNIVTQILGLVFQSQGATVFPNLETEQEPE